MLKDVQERAKEDLLPENIHGAKLLDVLPSAVEYWGNKYSEASEHYDNYSIAFRLSHEDIKDIFYIYVFKGAQCRETDVELVTASFNCLGEDVIYPNNIKFDEIDAKEAILIKTIEDEFENHWIGAKKDNEKALLCEDNYYLQDAVEL